MNVSGDLTEWPHSNSHEHCGHLSCGGDFSAIYVKLSSFSWQGEKATSVPSDFKSEG